MNTMPRLSDLTADLTRHTKSLDAARYIGCLVMQKGAAIAAAEQFRARWPASAHLSLIEHSIQKAAVVGGSSQTWGSPLIPESLMAALISFAQPYSILGRLNAQPVPFNAKVPIEAAPISGASWVGAGAGKPIVKGSLTTTMLPPRTAAGIIVLTEDVVRMGTPAAEILLRDSLARSIVQFLDWQFSDPSVAAVADLNPASLTNGLTPIAQSGDPVQDVYDLVKLYVAGGGRMETAAFVLSSANAVALRLLGWEQFRNLTPTGGDLAGIPAFAADAVGGNVILLDRARVLLADDGEMRVDASGQAALEMSDAPTQSTAAGSPLAPTPTQLVSLWQGDLVALKVERIINWWAAPGAVQYMTMDVAAGSPATP